MFNWLESFTITHIGWKPKHTDPPFIVKHLRTFILLSPYFRTQDTTQIGVMVLVVVPQPWIHPIINPPNTIIYSIGRWKSYYFVFSLIEPTTQLATNLNKAFTQLKIFNSYRKQNIYPLPHSHLGTCTIFGGQQTKDGSKNPRSPILMFSISIVHPRSMFL